MRLIIYTILVLAGFYFGMRTASMAAVDSCLDAGGAWSEARRVCTGVGSE